MSLIIPPYAFAGAIANRLRGGWLKHGLTVQQEEDLPLYDYRRHGRAINIAVFGVFAWLASGNALLGIMSALGMWGGQSLGWGRYIGAIAGTEKEKLEEVRFIDAIIRPFHPDNVQNKRLTADQQMFVWGFMGLTLRGLVWAMALAAAPISVYAMRDVLGRISPAFVLDINPQAVIVFMATGATMALIYSVVLHTWKRNPLAARNPIGIGWEAAELYYGAVLWGAYAVAFLQPLGR